MSRLIDVTIFSKPTSVSYECPHCKEIVEIRYKDFENLMSLSEHCWEGEEFCCPECGGDVEIDLLFHES